MTIAGFYTMSENEGGRSDEEVGSVGTDAEGEHQEEENRDAIMQQRLLIDVLQRAGFFEAVSYFSLLE